MQLAAVKICSGRIQVQCSTCVTILLIEGILYKSSLVYHSLFLDLQQVSDIQACG